MTACKDSQATSGKKAVSATLAGVLAVGMVPAVALADEAVEVTEEDGITELNTTAEAIMNGTIVLKSGQTAGQVFPASAAPNNYLVPMGIQPQGTTGASNRVTDLGAGNGWFYVPVSATGTNTNFVDQNGKTLKLDWDNNVPADAVPAEGIAAGEWALVAAVEADGTAVVKQAVTFTAQATSLANATIYEVKSDATDFSDVTFTYDGAAWDFGADKGDLNLVLNGKKLVANKDYTATVYDGKGQVVADGPKYAGTYRVVIDGLDGTTGGTGDYSKDKQIEKVLTIAPIDLSTAKVYYEAQQVPDTGAVTEGSILAGTTTVNDLTLQELGLAVGTAPSINYYIQPSSLTTKTVGGYTVTFTPDIPSTADDAAALAGSFTGTASGTLYVTSEANLVDANFKFNGKQIGQAGADNIIIDYSAKKPTAPTYNKWSSSLVEVTDANSDMLDPSVYTIQVLDSEGNDVGVEGLAKRGAYKLSVVIDPANTDPAYAFAGKSATMNVTVTYGNVASADIAYTADGELLDTTGGEASVDYTGSPIAIGTNVKFQGKDVPASEYTVTITKDGKAVDQVLDAGEYVITVKSDKYTLAGNVITLTVDPMSVTPSDVKGSMKVKYGSNTYSTIFYTGSDITPTFTFENLDGDKVEVPADSYSISLEYAEKQGDTTGSFKPADSIKAAGTYKVTVSDALKDNYDVQDNSAAPFILVVNNGDVFIDVPADAWYSTPVYKAVELKYMNGYAESQTFGPNDRITRGQVACVLYNMAGGEDFEFNPGYDENLGVVTGFSDVDGHMYYAKPIAWAKQMGVINGFAGTDQFGPDQNITREQFAAMLANYAKKANDFDLDPADIDGILAAMPDGSAVSDWARESVAWAVQAKVMGNGGVIDPMNQISRAETAAMAVNYQPEKPDTIIK